LKYLNSLYKSGLRKNSTGIKRAKGKFGENIESVSKIETEHRANVTLSVTHHEHVYVCHTTHIACI
jgi:hypothetical protein